MDLRIYPDKRVEMVDEDGSIIERDERPPNDPSLYLRDASRALRDCGSAPALYGEWHGEDKRQGQAGLAYLQAPERRTELARTSILFSAFAAEAYVNGFLADQLGKAFTDELELRSTIDKYVDLVPQANPDIKFERGRGPGQGLVKLLRARSYLVHPKPGAKPKDPITPLLAADCLVAAAQAARLLTAAAGKTDIYALLFSEHVSEIHDYARRSMETLPDLDAPAPSELLMNAANAVLGGPLNAHMRAHKLERQRERGDGAGAD